VATFGADELECGLQNLASLGFEQVMKEIFCNGDFFCEKCMPIVTKHINIEKLMSDSYAVQQTGQGGGNFFAPMGNSTINASQSEMVLRNERVQMETQMQTQLKAFELPDCLVRIEQITKNDSFGRMTNLLENLFDNEMFARQKLGQKIIEEKLCVAVEDLKICQINLRDYQTLSMALCKKISDLKKSLTESNGYKDKHGSLVRKLKVRDNEINKWKRNCEALNTKMSKLKESLVEFVNEDHNYMNTLLEKIEILKVQNLTYQKLLGISETAQKKIEVTLDLTANTNQESNENLLEKLIVGPSAVYREKVQEYLEDLKNKRSSLDLIDNAIDNMMQPG
jgi:hypothetical protein